MTPQHWLLTLQRRYLDSAFSFAEYTQLDRFPSLLQHFRYAMWHNRAAVLTLPTVRDDGTAGYVVLPCVGAAKFVADSVRLADGCDRPAIALALMLCESYGDKIDLRRWMHTDLCGLCRSYLTGTQEDREGALGMAIADCLYERGICEFEAI